MLSRMPLANKPVSSTGADLADQISRVKDLVADGFPVNRACRKVGIPRATFYYHVTGPEMKKLRALADDGADVTPLSETIGAHADLMVPESEPGQQEAAETAAPQS